jgi:catechol 2,3-dioxygenase-like lactoylglutathione lyase family enzyme
MMHFAVIRERSQTMPATQQIPGLTGIEHIGLTVPDIDRATGFLAALLGAETLYDIGPFESPDDWMAGHLATHPRGKIHKIRVLRVANGPVLELFQFVSADRPAPLPAKSDTGWHIAFYVDDMERAVAALKTHEVAIQSGPVVMTEGPSAGLTWLYFQAPWGQQMELVSYPGGIAAYRGLREVWRPHS